MGVTSADADDVPALQLARFVCGVVGAHDDAPAVAHALAAAAAPAEAEGGGGAPSQGAEAAGEACRVA
eukprot:194761-Pleurochrysis_carterae.AAC.1